MVAVRRQSQQTVTGFVPAFPDRRERFSVVLVAGALAPPLGESFRRPSRVLVGVAIVAGVGRPQFLERSGRGLRKLWSLRPSTTM